MTEVEPEGPDTIADEDFAALNSYLPDEAGKILRRVMRRVRNVAQAGAEVAQALQQLHTGHQNQRDQIEALQGTVDEQATALQQLNAARQAQANRITQLENRVTVLEGGTPPAKVQGVFKAK